jgi:hypothetical protein
MEIMDDLTPLSGSDLCEEGDRPGPTAGLAERPRQGEAAPARREGGGPLGRSPCQTHQKIPRVFFLQ